MKLRVAGSGLRAQQLALGPAQPATRNRDMHERRRNQILRSEILDLGDYERQRDGIRQRAISARAIRRVELGPNATIAFENRETVKYQIQEMLRAERIAKEPEVLHEIETYSDLLPTPDELSATLMFEFPEAGARDHGHRLWCLLVLELWVREHVEAPIAVPA